MIGQAIGATLGFAVGIAISPIPIAAVILMLFSGRARSNSLSFMLGWVVGIALVTSVVMLVPGLQTEGSEPSDTTGWIKLVLGVLLLVVGARQWRSRPRGDEEPAVPGWMERIDDLRPVAAVGMGLLLSAVNPKNLLLAAAAGASFGALTLSGGETVAAVVVFVLIASITVTAPVLGYLLAGDRLETTLDRAKSWLIGNNAVVMAVLLAVFGANLLGDGLQILT
jgi:threonine/homoserine/homoserine lactone efflux protein